MATMQDKIVQDLKAAMLSKNVLKTSVLRSIKSAFIYAKVAPGSTIGDSGELSDDAVMGILAKEAKKRQESADSFVQAGQPDRAEAELAEKTIIEEYLPTRLTEAEVQAVVDEVMAQFDEISPKIMGQVISQTKAKAGPSADGALIARLVKGRLTQ